MAELPARYFTFNTLEDGHRVTAGDIRLRLCRVRATADRDDALAATAPRS
jgi:hypothetical protein